MKNLLTIFLLILSSTGCFSQPKYAVDVIFKDSTRTPLSFIRDDFFAKIKNLNTNCLYAFGSAKFTIHSDERITDIQVSTGIPDFIAKQLRESIISTLYFWSLKNKYTQATIIIPIFVAPATACRVEQHQDSIYSSAANMFNYISTHTFVRRDEYYKKAKRTETGIIFPMLLIKDSFVK